MKALLTGATGQVGRALVQTAPAHVELCKATRQELDIRDPAAIREVVAACAPQVIINAAAYTAVDRAESEPAEAMVVNGLAPGYLAEAARSTPGCRLVHISTDYVFDGRSERPYRPNDATNPLSVYGRSKLQGEQAVMRILEDRAVVLRTAWIYAAVGKNFLLTMLRLMRERGEVRVVADQRGAPTSALSVARAIWRTIESPSICGILHWTDEAAITWFDFASAIAEAATSGGLLEHPPRLHPITTAEFPTSATRPKNSVLDLRTSAAALGLEPIPWRNALDTTLAAVVQR